MSMVWPTLGSRTAKDQIRSVALIGTNGELQNIFFSHGIRLEFVLFKNKNSGENITRQHAYQMCTLCYLVCAVLHIFENRSISGNSPLTAVDFMVAPSSVNQAQ